MVENGAGPTRCRKKVAFAARAAYRPMRMARTVLHIERHAAVVGVIPVWQKAGAGTQR